jgi:transcriptional regulator with XRE-family HTH domain
MTLGRRIIAARENIGLTQRQLAAAMGISHTLISLWESDKRTPSFESLAKIAENTLSELAFLRFGADGPPDLEAEVAKNADELEALRLFRQVSERQRQNLIRVMRHCIVVRQQVETQSEPV